MGDGNTSASDICNSIRARRKQLGWTQEAVAERAGMSPEGFARIERGHRVPSLDSFVAICRALATSPNALLQWGDDPPAASSAEAAGLREMIVDRVDELDGDALRFAADAVDFAWRHR